MINRIEGMAASNFPLRDFRTTEIEIKNFKVKTPYRGITSHELNGKKQIPSQIVMTSLIALRDQGPYNKEKVYKFLHDGNFSQKAIREIGLNRRLFEHFPYTILAIYPSLDPYSYKKEGPQGNMYNVKVNPGIDHLSISDPEKELFLQKIIQIGTKERYDAVILPMVSKSADVNVLIWSKVIRTLGQQTKGKLGISLIPSIDMNIDTGEFLKLLNFSISASKAFSWVEPVISFRYHKYETGNVSTNTATAKEALRGENIATIIYGIKRNLDNGNSGIQDQTTTFGDILFLRRPMPPPRNRKVNTPSDLGFYNSRLAKIEKLNTGMSAADLLFLRHELSMMFGVDSDFVKQKIDEYIAEFKKGQVGNKLSAIISGISRVHEAVRSSSEMVLLRNAASEGGIDIYAATKPWLFS
jgi:hypothetical protein